MTYAITWEPSAVDLASRFLADDPTGLRALVAALDALADDPRPSDAFPFGATGLLRLRVGQYRVIYEVDDVATTVVVMHIGRSV